MGRLDFSKETAKRVRLARRKADAEQAFWRQQRQRDRIWTPRIEHEDRERNKR